MQALTSGTPFPLSLMLGYGGWKQQATACWAQQRWEIGIAAKLQVIGEAVGPLPCLLLGGCKALQCVGVCKHSPAVVLAIPTVKLQDRQ